MAQGLLQPLAAAEAAVNWLFLCGLRAPLMSPFCVLSETDLDLGLAAEREGVGGRAVMGVGISHGK